MLLVRLHALTTAGLNRNSILLKLELKLKMAFEYWKSDGIIKYCQDLTQPGCAFAAPIAALILFISHGNGGSSNPLNGEAWFLHISAQRELDSGGLGQRTLHCTPRLRKFALLERGALVQRNV